VIPTPEETRISRLKSAGTEHAPASLPQSIGLSDEVVLLYVLSRSGCVGQLTIGRVERVGPSQLKVYDKYGAEFEYVSGANLRSWCVFRPGGIPLEGWSEIQPEDLQKIGPIDGPRART
jgi:hypothetical protein